MTLLPLFEGASDEVSAQIRAYCGWHVAPELTETLVLDGSGTEVLYLPTLRVVDVVEVKVDGVTLAPSAYTWSEDGFIRRLTRHWPDRLRCIEVTLTHGFSDQGALLKTTAEQFTAFAAAASFGSMRVGQVQVGGGSAVPAHVAQTLDRFAL